MSPPREVPPHCTTHTPLRVRFVETDLMGIVHHGTYLTYFEAGRVDYLHKRGFSYETWTREGIHLPVVEASLRYRKASRFDDRLVVASTCAELTRVTVRFTYRILRGEDLLCEGFTLLACVGDDLAPKRLPAVVSEALTGPERPESEWT
ncbi:MAG: acyl-CoA thioesterase [Polyangiaceae bacterium]|jgi:acyl-CoA thioester hydrolase|nr:acyl-CoA thioesterase [Polyangiaceae bacterium]MBK8938349.1 acyl-CoA thioesterase [Polyangiaceae bacterium]